MRELSLFSGAGGGLLASILLGFRTVCYVEYDAYCQRVIQARIREGFLHDAPIWDDVRTFDGRPWAGLVDVITAGFPCQPFSSAGHRRGADDPRNMWPSTARIIREVGPRLVFLENVPALLGPVRRNGRIIRPSYFGDILSDLAESGYDVRWSCLSAAEVGAPHGRNRVWVLAHAGEQQGVERCIAPMLRGWAQEAEQVGLGRGSGPKAHSHGVGTESGREPRYMAGSQGAGQEKAEQRERDGNAALHSRATLADSDSQRESQSEGTLAQQRGWPGNGGDEIATTHAHSERCKERNSTAFPDAARQPPWLPAEAGSQGTDNVPHAEGDGWEQGGSLREGRDTLLANDGGVGGGGTDSGREEGEGWWSAEPPVGRVAHGLASKLD